MPYQRNPWTQALTTACLLFSLAASAQTSSNATTTTEREIQSLFRALQQSGCEFSRNGQWYNASQATEHLQRKYSYLQKKALVSTAEDFIARAASQSSVSSKSYLVRCPGQPELRSQQWFEAALAKTRAAQ